VGIEILVEQRRQAMPLRRPEQKIPVNLSLEQAPNTGGGTGIEAGAAARQEQF
jgi:hypothetical protein